MNLRRKIVCILLSIVFIIAIIPKSNAANLVISFSSSSAKVGDTVTATVTGKGAKGKVNLSATGNATLSENSVMVDGSASVSVKINGEGDVKVTATAAEMKDTSNSTSYSGATAGTIKVASNASTKKSNNANLSSLGIKPNDFKGFKISKTTYDVTVPNDVENVTIYATAQDKKATIEGIGAQKIIEGKNALNVVVTAEDGTTKKTYTINVTREAANNINETTLNAGEKQSENKEQATEENTDLKRLSIKGYDLTPAFSPNVYEYKVDVGKDVSKLDIETEGANNNVSVEIVGNEDLKDGENTVTLLVYNEETKQNSTYQIIVNKTQNSTGLSGTLNDAAKKANKIRLILLGVVLAIVICVVIFVIVKRKFNNDEDEKYEYDEDDIERLNLDDEDEFFNRVNNKDKAFANKIVGGEREESEEPFYKNTFIQNSENNEEEVDSSEEKISEYDTEDYFRTNKPKRKGKHF